MVDRELHQFVQSNLAVEDFLQGTLSDENIEAFLEKHQFPINEGTCSTFVYYGPADSISLGHWIHGLPASRSFKRVKGTNFWYLILELPQDSRIEYKMQRKLNGKTEWFLDSLNPNRAADPFGENSVCHTSGYEKPDWVQEREEGGFGTLKELDFTSAAFEGQRKVVLYLPAHYRETRRYPLLVVHDGQEYLRYSGMKVVLDNLIHNFEIPGMIVAFTQPEKRLIEYANHEPHARYLAEELLPYLEKELPLLESPRHRGLMGASLGAVGALTTAWRYPQVFGQLFLQSGSFTFTDIGDHYRGPSFDPVVEFMNAYREVPQAVANKIFISCGIYEANIYENRSIVPFLQKTGMTLRYVEARDGHNWENWRDRMREGLSWLFPGPLWMVYE